MTKEDKAYELGRAWRRGDINGNQFDFRLNDLGVTDDFVSYVIQKRDRIYLNEIIKEAFFSFSILLFVFGTIGTVSKTKETRINVYNAWILKN